MSSSAIIPDRVLGMLWGHAIAESLGAPYEFGYNNANPELPMIYDGTIRYRFYIGSRWPMKEKPGAILHTPFLLSWPSGIMTDDSAMTICALTSMVDPRGGIVPKYDKERTLQSYINWANTTPIDMGKNTRELFRHKLKDIRAKYEKVYYSKFLSPEAATKPPILSNGALMRCSPFALFPDLEAFREDCILTNPYPVAIECNLIYGLALWLAIRGAERTYIYNAVKSRATTPEVLEVFKQIDQGIIRDTSGPTNGFCCHGLWWAMQALVSPKNFRDYIADVATLRRTDTDTNAAIAGAMLGALHGYDTLMSDPVTRNNKDKLIQVNNFDYGLVLSKIGL